MANELRITAAGDAFTLYAIIRRVSDNYVWQTTTSTFVVWADGDIANYDTALTTRGGDLYTGDFPTDIAAGTRVLILHYKQLGGTPAITDTLMLTVDTTWNGAELVSASSITLDSRALTTLASVKRHMRITSTDDDTLLTELINQVSDRIERYVGRRFAAAEYREWIEPNGEDTVQVRNWPIIRVNRVGAMVDDVLTVAYSGSAIEALVSVEFDEEGGSGNVRLYSVTAAGVETTSDLSLTTYPTLSTLATAISAVSGWTGTHRGDDALSPTLEPMAGIGAKNVTVYLGAATAFDTEYQTVPRLGQLRLDGRCEGMRLVAYRGGYATIPDDVARVANEMVMSAYYEGRVNPMVQSESIPDYSYSLADRVKIGDAQNTVLNQYRSSFIGSAA